MKRAETHSPAAECAANAEARAASRHEETSAANGVTVAREAEAPATPAIGDSAWWREGRNATIDPKWLFHEHTHPTTTRAAPRA
jgi:hypothetical protein